MEYQGEDLIIVTGAPGSRWSGVIRMLTLMYKEINMSDNTNDYVYRKKVDGQTVGWHRGAYWGPNNSAGHKFDVLNTLTKEEIIKEFKAPFSDWHTGTKIIKSHWFAYHLPQLRQMFPKATMWAFYDTNEECYNWWHHVGGWDIYYPDYSWYEYDSKMKEQIAIENHNIETTFELKKYEKWKDAVSALGFSHDIRTIHEIMEVDPEFGELHQYDTEEVFHQLLNRMFARKKMGIIKPAY